MQARSDAGMRPGALEHRLTERLGELRRRRREDPSFNPIWRLASELAFSVETGALDRSALCGFSGHLLERSLDERGGRLGRKLAPLDEADNRRRLRHHFSGLATSCDFAAFAARLKRPFLGVVFTAHPTFLLSGEETARLIAAATGGDGPVGFDMPGGGGAIRLEDEHRAALGAIANARHAIGVVLEEAYGAARTAYPDDWRALEAVPFDLASWVGYDMDGRTDIGWASCMRLRLTEKCRQIEAYLADISELRSLPGADAVGAALDRIEKRLAGALGHSRRAVERFTVPLDDPRALAVAANGLTAEDHDRLVALAPLVGEVEALIGAADEAGSEALAIALAVLAARMRIFRLGVGRIHFRINATQLHNAIRRRLESEGPVDLSSRTALVRLNALYEKTTALDVNFAALAVETTTAVRQFLTIAQIFKHIDAESDIRLLIAECERPATVLAALCLARLFGVEDRIDVSPLFETPSALEGGERFIDVLFSQPAYRAAAERRGRIALQTGFSDAGRFIGQIPASLSIERLQANMARLVERHALGHLECLIFNTHGESMGRGAHPASLRARFDHALSPWARRQFAARGLALRPEASFQGGDGYLWFAQPAMALALLTRLVEHQTDLAARGAVAEKEEFYATPDISLDFFRRVMRFQESLLRSPVYHRSLTAFGLALLKTTGSRKSRRQFEQGAGERHDIAKVRAIPHNGVLQQLGYPVNVVGGVGQATRAGTEPYADWRRAGGRFADLMDLVVEGRTRASLRTLLAYGSLFDGGYWAARPHGEGQAHLTDACLYLAELLERDDRHGASLELATRLRVDELLLHRLLRETGEDEAVLEAPERDFLALLHAVRIALIQHLFLLAARIPRFSARNDVGREDIMELVFELRIEEAVALLREAYPMAAPRAEDYDLEEPTEYPDETAMNYADINERLIDPLETLHRCLLEISVAVANAYGAHG